MNLGMLFLNLLIAIGTLIIAVGTMKLWRETKEQRKSSQRPILVPCRLGGRPVVLGTLFAANYGYPIVDEIKRSLLYTGVKNIGMGVAIDVRVKRFQPSCGQPVCWHSTVHIAPSEYMPLLIRFGFDNSDYDLETKSQNILIEYKDVYGQTYFLQMELWFRDLEDKDKAEAIVIRHVDTDQKMPAFEQPIFREVEHLGLFELDELFNKSKQ